MRCSCEAGLDLSDELAVRLWREVDVEAAVHEKGQRNLKAELSRHVYEWE